MTEDNTRLSREDFLRQAGKVAAATPILGVPLLVDEAEASKKSDRIIKFARKKLGTPYRKMNCSEYTRWVYNHAVGVRMPANYVTQRSYGRPVKKPRRGDLLLFRDHVGIYYGNGKIIHSSSYFGEVVISELQYLKGYLGARRIR
jgi:cell wall-associated NlpC family hydrolase